MRLLASFEQKSGCIILDLLEFVKKVFWRARLEGITEV